MAEKKKRDRDVGNIQVKKSTAEAFIKARQAYAKQEGLGDLKNDQFMQKLLHVWNGRTEALGWYGSLLNDLINDDDIKRTEHVGRILEYARVAAGLSEKDVEIKTSEEFVPHDPDFVAEHIQPVVRVHDKPPFEEGTELTVRGKKLRIVRNEGAISVGTLVDDEQEPKQ